MTERAPMKNTNSTPSTVSRWHQLRTYLTVAFTLLGALPVLIVTLAILNRTGSQARDQVYNQLDSVAELKSDQILRWLDEGNLAMDTLLSGPNSDKFSNFAELPTSVEARIEISEILAGAAESKYFNHLFIYNESGIVVASSEPDHLNQSIKEEPYFEVSLHADYIQSPVPDPITGQLVMYITRPLRSGKIQASGVLVGELNIDTLADIMTERTGLGASGETYLVSLQSNHLLTPSRFEGYEMNVAYHSEGIDQALEGIRGRGLYESYRPVTVFGSYQFIPELEAALLAEVEQSQALAAYRQAQFLGILIAILSDLFAIAVGFYISRSIARPILDLAVSAQRIGSGDLKAEVVELRRQDEIGVLARAFHQMQSELVASYEELEQRVADRTKALATTTEVSRQISTIMDRQKLIEEVVQRVNSAFNFYHTQIYFFDPNGEELVLAGGTGEIGKKLLEQGHKLAKGKGLVGRAAETNAPVIVSDVSTDRNWLPNSLLPETKSEIAVPIAAGDTVIGVLDVQHNIPGGLTKDDVNVLQSIANQITIAVQNGRQYMESLQFKMGIENSGDAVFATDKNGIITYANPAFEKVYGYAPSEVIGKNPRIIKSGLMTLEYYQTLWKTLLSKNSAKVEVINRHKDGHLVHIAGTNTPIVNNAGEIIGFMAVQRDVTEQKKNQDLIAQNARRQEAVNQISQKIQSTATIEEAMQVAARELGHALGNRQTVVALDPSGLSAGHKEN